jgi:hypothetical protein
MQVRGEPIKLAIIVSRRHLTTTECFTERSEIPSRGGLRQESVKCRAQTLERGPNIEPEAK